MFSQSSTWADGRWRYGGEVWDRWQVGPERSGPSDSPRVLVTTGTARDFAFAAMVDACRRVLDPSWDIVWQIGDHPHPPLPGRVVSSLSYDEMLRLTRSVDVVVSHAGVGSTILALEAGRRPVLFARTAARGEHVDDHQVELVGSLAARGLAEVVDPPEAFTVEHIDRALRSSVVERADGHASWHF